MRTTTFTPVWNHRELLGHATTAAGAERLVRRTLGPASIGRFTLRVWRRLPVVIETQGLADGWVYALSYT
jgi:hypothetical protein